MATAALGLSTCLSAELDARFRHFWHLVGNPPRLAQHYTYRGQPGRMFAKCEHYNLTGSLKDRLVLYILHQAYLRCAQGISDEFILAIVQLDELDAVVQAHDGDAVLMAWQPFRQLGLAVGILPGASMIGAIQLAAELGPEAVVVTLLCDNNKKYLSTDLVRQEPVRAGYLSPEVVFTGYHPMQRLREPLLG